MCLAVIVVMLLQVGPPTGGSSTIATARSTRPESPRLAALPAVPAVWPSTVELGTLDDLGHAATTRAAIPFRFRYHYLAGGVNTGSGWATWDPDGSYVSSYVAESVQSGTVPVFSYYMIRQSSPGDALGEADGVHANLRDAATMTAYFEDLRLFFARAGAFSGATIVLHVEPDMWGYIEQRAAGDDAATVPVKVAATGLPELDGLPDSAVGLAQAIVKMRDLYAPNVLLAYSLSIWGTGTEIIASNPSNAKVDSLAARSARFYRSLQAAFDITFAEYTDRDAAFKQFVEGAGTRLWWDAADFNRHARYLSAFVDAAQSRVVLWQIPLGNTRMRAMNNSWGHYQDNKVEWLLDDPTRTHLGAYVDAGVVAFLFGGGADGTTCACDGAHDGVTDPQPINGNTGLSLSADDDGGYFRQKAGEYYADGRMQLSAVGSVPAAPAPGQLVLKLDGNGPPAPMPVISRTVPAFTSATSSPYGPQRGNDDNYGTMWRSVAIPAWLAYDLSSVPVASRTQVVAAWYNNATGDYDHRLGGTFGYNLPASYTIDANAAPGGSSPPSTDWVPLVTMSGNTYHSRQHLLDLTGYNWVRINVTESDGSPQNDDVALNFDLHDASLGVEDDWIFYGDSISAAGMAVTPQGGQGTFAQMINLRAPAQFPIQEAGGTGYLRSDESARRINEWLATFPGTYVGLSFGSNDCGATSPDEFYRNYATMVDAVLRAGKTPVVSKIPWAKNPHVQTYGPILNAKIDELYAAYPQIVRGPDFWAFFEANPGLISKDDLHPSPEGEVAYRQQWADQMLAAVYGLR